MDVINFITKRDDHDPILYKSPKYKVVSSFSDLEIYLKNCLKTGRTSFDTEYNKGRLFEAELLLGSLGEEGNLFVVDLTHSDTLKEFAELFNTYSSHLCVIGHNLQSDYTICKWHGIHIQKFWDTMVAEQRLNMGMNLSNSYENTFIRRLKRYMAESKDIREDFLTMNRSSKFLVKHISYSGGDVADIIEIATIQKTLLNERNQLGFFKNVENELIPILGDMCLEGCWINEDRWNTMIRNKQGRKLELERIMDKMVSDLLHTRYKERKRGEYVELSLFGDHVEFENENKKFINYNSSDQVLDIFRKTGQALPTYVDKGKTTKSTKEEALQQYLIEYPFTPLRNLIDDLIEFRGHQKLISSYGKKFLNSVVRKRKKKEELGFKSPYTNRVHTVYKQCFTNTGRLSSGDKEKGLYNSQNMSTESEVRECFTLSPQEIADGWWITTCDWTGAELIIMAALADDQHLYELGADKIVDGVLVEGDLHSPLATKSWRAVWKYRNDSGRDMEIKDTKGKVYLLTENVLIDKTNNKQLRTDFKRMGFGVVYGLKAVKGGQTLNIPKDEASIVIDVISKEIPNTMRMVEDSVVSALTDGYVIFNHKSYNRRWFPQVLGVLSQINEPNRAQRAAIVKNALDFSILAEIEGEARNCRIQGTQADMLKEAEIAIKKKSIIDKVPLVHLLSVHDEVVCKHKGKEYGEVIAQTMRDVANSYLSIYSSNIKMNADYKTLHTWVK